MMLHDKHWEWIEARGIAPELIELLGLETLPKDGAKWLVVPYLENGKPVNRKWRLTSRKDHRMDTGAPLLLWNCDSLNGAETTIITEGEWDAMAVMSAIGIEQSVVSVPNGAPGDVSENPWEAHRYEWFQRHRKVLDRIQTFIIAVDNDDAGRFLAADLATLFGPERCKFVTYPEGCKDFNEVLLAHGEQAVADIIEKAKPYPVKGLYRFSDYPPRSEATALHCRLPGVAGRWPLVMSTFSVITGWSGRGKTTMLCWIVADYLQQGVTVCVASFETDPHILRKQIKAALMRKPYWDRAVHEPDAEIDAMIERQVILIAQHCGDEESEMSLEYMLDCSRVAAIRDGARLFIYDPWNEIEHRRRRDETETDYAGRAIRAIKRFARRYNVAVWLVAHPTKPPPGSDLSKPPTLYSISGSSNFVNKADYGVIIHWRDKGAPYTDLIIDKVRMSLPGEEGRRLLAYNKLTSGFDLEE